MRNIDRTIVPVCECNGAYFKNKYGRISQWYLVEPTKDDTCPYCGFYVYRLLLTKEEHKEVLDGNKIKWKEEEDNE